MGRRPGGACDRAAHRTAPDRAARCVRGLRALLLPPARALGARRCETGDARRAPVRAPARGRSRRDGAGRPRGRRCSGTCSSSRPTRRKGARGTAVPAQRSSSTGSPCSTVPACTCCRSASRRRTSSSRCSSARSKGSAPPRASARCPTRRRSGPASSTCARTCSAARVDDLRALAAYVQAPRVRLAASASARLGRCACLRPRLTVVGSINLDLVARAERLPRPGETVTDATFSRIPVARARTRPSRPPVSAPCHVDRLRRRRRACSGRARRSRGGGRRARRVEADRAARPASR